FPAVSLRDKRLQNFAIKRGVAKVVGLIQSGLVSLRGALEQMAPLFFEASLRFRLRKQFRLFGMPFSEQSVEAAWFRKSDGFFWLRLAIPTMKRESHNRD